MYSQELGVAYYRAAVVKSAVKQDYLVCVEFVAVALDSNFEGASQGAADFVVVAVFVQLHRINDIGGFYSGVEYFTLVELTNSLISICCGKRKPAMSSLRKQGARTKKTGFPPARE